MNTLAKIQNAQQCQVCGERSDSVSLYYGAVSCQACKVSFILIL